MAGHQSLIISLLSILPAFQICGGSIVNIPPRDGNFELLILHNNDMHARFEQTSQISSICSPEDEQHNRCYGGFARVANRVRHARKQANEGSGPPVLYLNAGDTYTGTVWFAFYKWRIAADFINILQPDAVSLGNHEFDKGISGLSPFIRNLSCPVLCANIDLEKVPELKSETNLKKSIIKEINNRKIGIIGYLTPDTKYLIAPNDVEYIDEVIALREEVAKMREQGVNIIIALGHSGYEADLRIAKEVDGIDLVIGGHSNTFLWNGKAPDIEIPEGTYPTFVYQKSGKKVPVVQAYAYTKYLGKLHLVFDAEGEISHIDGQPILLDSSIDREADVLQLLAKYRPQIVKYTETKVGFTTVLLDGSTQSCRIQECNLGNLITDALVYSYASNFPSSSEYAWSNAPIGIIQGGGIRGSINKGNVSRADLMSVLPFENEIVTAKVKGNILRSALEWSVYNYDVTVGSFMQYSGIRVAYNLSMPAGKRLLYANVRCGNCTIPEYKPLSDSEVYTIIMPDFLLYGGDKYTMFAESAELSERLGQTDLTVVEEFIKKRSPVYPEVQGRIILHGKVDSSAVIVNTNLFLIFTSLLFSKHVLFY